MKSNKKKLHVADGAAGFSEDFEVFAADLNELFKGLPTQVEAFLNRAKALKLQKAQTDLQNLLAVVKVFSRRIKTDDAPSQLPRAASLIKYRGQIYRSSGYFFAESEVAEKAWSGIPREHQADALGTIFDGADEAIMNSELNAFTNGYHFGQKHGNKKIFKFSPKGNGNEATGLFTDEHNLVSLVQDAATRAKRHAK